MTFGEAAQVIRYQVDMRQIADMYGIPVKRGGFIVCPFHGDHDASLKIYSQRGGHAGWHCFGCGAGGSVIDFVMKYDSCSFSAAVGRINDRLSLGLLSVDNMFEREARRNDQRKYDSVREAFDEYIDSAEAWAEREIEFLFRWLQEIEAVPKAQRTAEAWTRHLWLQEELKYHEYLLSECNALRKEVIEWRNQSRAQNLSRSS